MRRSHWRYPTPKVCPTCGAEFRPWSLAQRFCSMTCRPPQEKTIAPNPCGWCGKSYARAPSTGSKFCSTTCSFAAHREKAWADKVCLNCGVTFKRRTQPSWGTPKRVFCSKPCSQQYTVGENHPMNRGGKCHGMGYQWKRRSEEIRVRDGRRCRRCGKTEAENVRRLSVDHVIPRRYFESLDEANDPENLVALCDTCHGRKTATAEFQFLRGDVLAMKRYREAVALPWPDVPQMDLGLEKSQEGRAA